MMNNMHQGITRGIHLGASNGNWRGGRTVTSSGYVLIRRPGHHLADVRGYVYEHRLVAEEMIGRHLLPGEEVHHRDENKQNNHPDNLYVAPSRLHHQLHHRKRCKPLRNPGDLNIEVDCACGCGTKFNKFDYQGRARRFISGHNIHRKRI